MDKIIAVLVIGLVSSPSVWAAFLTKPTNFATIKGNTASFTCRGQSIDAFLTWDKSTASNPTNFFNVALNEEVFFEKARYSVTFDIISFTSTLTITNIQPSDAGGFACVLFTNQEKAYAQLIVLETPPTCDTNLALDRVSVGDTLTVTCQVQYYSSTSYGPSMMWSLADGSSLTPTDLSTRTQVKYAYTVTVAQSLSGQQFRVVTTFPQLAKNLLPNQSWDHDLSAPAYGNIYTTATIDVLSQVTQVTFSNQKPEYNVGESITCQSNGQPAPARRWTKGGLTVNGDVLQITSSMVGQNTWTCIASHTVKGTFYTQQATISFVVKGSIVSSANAIHLSFAMILTSLGLVFIY